MIKKTSLSRRDLITWLGGGILFVGPFAWLLSHRKQTRLIIRAQTHLPKSPGEIREDLLQWENATVQSYLKEKFKKSGELIAINRAIGRQEGLWVLTFRDRDAAERWMDQCGRLKSWNLNRAAHLGYSIAFKTT